MLDRILPSKVVLALITLSLAGCTLVQNVATPVSSEAIPTGAEEVISPTPQVEASAPPLPENTPPGEPGSTADTIKYVLVPERSEARYLVREQLAGLSLPSDAIGRTQEISGQVVVNADGTIVISESQFVVQLGSLRSDESRRDSFVRRNTLQTDQHPIAVFIPNQVSGLPAALPQSGQVSFKLLGDLTIRDETNPVEWEVSAEIQGGEMTGRATTSFTFDDFSLVQPRVPVVLSVEDTIRLEVDFTFIAEEQAEAAAMAQEGSESPQLLLEVTDTPDGKQATFNFILDLP